MPLLATVSRHTCSPTSAPTRPCSGNALIARSVIRIASAAAPLLSTSRSPVARNGPVAVVSFDVVGNGVEKITLTLESVYAYDATSLLDMVTESSVGSFTLESKAVISPGLSFPR